MYRAGREGACSSRLRSCSLLCAGMRQTTSTTASAINAKLITQDLFMVGIILPVQAFSWRWICVYAIFPEAMVVGTPPPGWVPDPQR